MKLGGKPRRRRAIASSLVVSVVLGIPLTMAVLHPGFPVSDVDLTARDVWVTNGEQLLGGRLNRQIEELNGSVIASSPQFDVLQDGDALFMVDPDASRVESVDPATTEVTSAIDIPEGAEVAFGGDLLAVMSADGDVWAISTVGDLQLNHISTPPVMELGQGAHIAVSDAGVLVGVSPAEKQLFTMENLAEEPVSTDFPGVGEFQLAMVGDQPVVLDQSTNEVVTGSGSRFALEKRALRLQQTGPGSEHAVLATGDSLLRVHLDSGDVEEVTAGIESEISDPSQVSAPVQLEGCSHGAWAAAQRYVFACEGESGEQFEIPQPTQGSELEFRVNRTVIALNDLDNGNVWLVDDNMRLVENWEDVTPPEEQETEEVGDEKSAIQSFEETLAERTETNRPPTANDDDFGIRPGRTTILTLLDNDTDPDGDVLVISRWDAIAESTGILDAIDGGRALQFTPVPGFVGSVSFSYTVDDGRDGTDTARVTVRVVPEGTNEPPYALRTGGVTVEANQTVTYNVLADWRDPDGDELYLTAAAPKSGDTVRFTPDGFVTFTHNTSEMGEKEVLFTVSDGSDQSVQGTLVVKVEPPGTLNPIATPDFATTFVRETVVIDPTLNDLSPSGAQLGLSAIEEPGGDTATSFNSDDRTISFSATAAGVYYVKYTVTAGANSSVGLVRFDVRDKPVDDEVPPIAVKDTAFLRGEEPTTVSVLANDVSPSGRVLAVQSVSVPQEVTARGVVVEVIESTLIRVTSPSALTEQVAFTYTVSDGLRSATAGVTVVPVPALTKHQTPVAQNDSRRVRAGDIATVDVLKNDFHPDGSPMYLDTELVTEPADGIAFVSNDRLRFQAPTEAGDYRVDYRVLDPYGETATATAVFTVVPVNTETNRDPEPTPIVARVLAGGQIRVDIPLHGVDPDGDSVQLLNFPTNPSLGSVAERGPDYFIYEASPTGAGTDTFSYEVYDAFGATGVADIRIAVIPEPAELKPPSALPDSVSIRPGRIAQVDLLANDSDPQGAPIKVSEELIDVPEGIEAEVVRGQYLVIEAPETEQLFSLRYELTNDRGGSAVTYVLVTVTPQAPLLPPAAEDIPILEIDIAGEESITVDVFDGFAFNPSGRTEDLVLSIEGPNADAAELLESPGEIRVTPGEVRQAVAYRVTNTEDDLSAMAFILVPAAVDEDFDSPAYIDPNLPVQYVDMNDTREWNLADILIVPSGRDAWIFDPTTVSAVQSNGDSAYVDETTIRFTGAQDYRGPAAINFTVTDGASRNDPAGVVANLTLPIVVGDPEFRDTPPEFTPPQVQVEVGEESTIDLRSSTAHPNPQILQEVTYSNITGQAAGLTDSLRGSELTVSVPRDTRKGTTITLGVTLRWDAFEVPGTINVVVVGSTRPPAVAVTDEYEMQRGGGDTGSGTLTARPLGNDSNPYQTTGEPLTIVDAQVSNTGEPASISFTGETVRITPSPSLKSGVIEVIYTIEDATKDPDRRVNGTIRLTVSDVPDEVAKPTRDPNSAIGGDGTATFRFTAPATNGKPITSYEVRTNPAVSGNISCTAGAPCTLTGLTNGTPYQISVRAINERGPGAWSVMSDPITPYGTPQTPKPTLRSQSKWAPSTITWTWPLVAGTGGQTTYSWTASNGASGSGVDLTSATISGVAAGNYTITVTATNTGGKSSAGGTSSPVTVRNQPVPTAPRNVSTPAGGEGARTLTWTWSAPSNATSDAAGDGLSYRYRINGGAWQNTTGTSATYSAPNSTANYQLEVYATNSGGDGPTSSSGTTRITRYVPPPPPPDPEPDPEPKVTLSKGTRMTCGSSGSFGCHSFNITVSGFPAGSKTVRFFCNGSDMGYARPMDGNTYTSNSPHCGWPNTWVTVNGVRSNTVDFRP